MSYNEFIIRLVRFFRVRSLTRWAYYWLARPKSKKIGLFFEGIESQFYVNTPLELRAIGVLSGERLWGERLVLSTLLKELQPGDIAYDIGAHIGTHTIFMAKQVTDIGKIVAFEPEIQSYETLKANIELNNLNNIITIQVALGDKFAESPLKWRNKIIGAYSLLGEGSKNSLPHYVKIVPGDFIVQSKKLPFPKAVKIDVEGYEYYVIQGLERTLTSEMCQMVCCEIHPTMLPQNIKSDTVIELLKSYGFSSVQTSPTGQTFHAFFYKRKGKVCQCKKRET